jgi:hypothetical protein
MKHKHEGDLRRKVAQLGFESLEQAVESLYGGLKSVKLVALQLGVTSSSVVNWCKYMGIALRSQGGATRGNRRGVWYKYKINGRYNGIAFVAGVKHDNFNFSYVRCVSCGYMITEAKSVHLDDILKKVKEHSCGTGN